MYAKDIYSSLLAAEYYDLWSEYLLLYSWEGYVFEKPTWKKNKSQHTVQYWPYLYSGNNTAANPKYQLYCILEVS